ncbi:hypothetical protein ACRAWF_39305 [Streptomyces sp. L7]
MVPRGRVLRGHLLLHRRRLSRPGHHRPHRARLPLDVGARGRHLHHRPHRRTAQHRRPDRGPPGHRRLPAGARPVAAEGPQGRQVPHPRPPPVHARTGRGRRRLPAGLRGHRQLLPLLPRRGGLRPVRPGRPGARLLPDVRGDRGRPHHAGLHPAQERVLLPTWWRRTAGSTGPPTICTCPTPAACWTSPNSAWPPPR